MSYDEERNDLFVISRMRGGRYTIVLAILIFPVLMNLPALLNVLKGDSALLYSGLAKNVHHGLLSGYPLIDPNVGTGFQCTGKRAADELLRGHLPWWNAFQGVGAPLSGEMVSAAFYPLTLLLELPRGQVLIQIIIQALAGCATWSLLCELGLKRLAAAAGALLFELNGTAAWLGSGWIYGMPCLPLLLLGIELSRRDSRGLRFRGGAYISGAVAISISAGFIEIPYLDGLLGIAWATLRFWQTPGDRRLRFACHVVGSGVGGILLALPVVIAFFDYLKIAYVGGHNGSGFFDAHLSIEALAQKFFPYIYGPIFRYGSLALGGVWGNTGGYAGLGIVILAISGVLGRGERGLRVLLFTWIILTLGATFGLPIVHRFVVLWPGVRYTAQYRYFDTSWEFALCVLAAFALDDSLELRRATWFRRCAVGTSAVVAISCVSLFVSRGLVRSLWPQQHYKLWFFASISAAFLIILAIVVGSRISNASRRRTALAIVISVEAMVMYTVPTLSHPTSGEVDTSGVTFLERQDGLQRVYSMGPIVPNYGSYYGLATINYQDPLMAQAWIDYVQANLDPYVNPLVFLGTMPGPERNVPSRATELLANLSAFEQAGVKFVVTPPTDDGLFSQSFEPQVGSGQQQGLPLFPGDSLQIALSSIPTGRMTGIEIVQGNYGNSADGALSIRLCEGTRCVTGVRAFSDSRDNSYFFVPFHQSFFGDMSTATLTLTHVGGKTPDAVWFWAGTPDSEQHARANGNDLVGYGVRMRVDYASRPFEAPVVETGDLRVNLDPGAELTVDIAAGLPHGNIAGIGIFVGDDGGASDGVLESTACSGRTCRTARRDLIQAGAKSFFWLPLEKHLTIQGGQLKLRMKHVGGQRPAVLWLWPSSSQLPEVVTVGHQPQRTMSAKLQLEYVGVGNPAGKLVYKNDVMNVYELGNPRHYFAARGCSLLLVSRTEVTATCAQPTVLQRLELFAAGWSATVNGLPATVGPFEKTFQQIALPAGKSLVTFSFTPPFMGYGFSGFFCALAAFISQIGLAVAYRRDDALS